MIGRRRFLGLLAAVPAVVACKPATAASEGVYVEAGRLYVVGLAEPVVIEFSGVADPDTWAPRESRA